MIDFGYWLNTLSQTAIAVGVLYGLWRMIQITREARAAREQAVASSLRAEKAATVASEGVERLGARVDVVADNVLKIEVSTNSMKDALVSSTAKASRLEGKEEQRIETEQRHDGIRRRGETV